jgi:hypothetical protein
LNFLNDEHGNIYLYLDKFNSINKKNQPALG